MPFNRQQSERDLADSDRGDVRDGSCQTSRTGKGTSVTAPQAGCTVAGAALTACQVGGLRSARGREPYAVRGEGLNRRRRREGTTHPVGGRRNRRAATSTHNDDGRS